jgi:hypothetical protein
MLRQQQSLNQLITQVTGFAASAVATLLSKLTCKRSKPFNLTLWSLIGVEFALSGALGAFSVLQKSMDIIWAVHNAERGRAAFMKEKVVPFALIIGLGLLVAAWTAFLTVLFNTTVLILDPL